MGIEITMRVSEVTLHGIFGYLRIISVMISDAARKYTKACSRRKNPGAVEQFPSLLSINDSCTYGVEPTDYGRACGVWANNEISQHHNCCYWYEQDEGRPPEDLHFVLSVDKSPKKEEKGKFDRKYSSPTENCGPLAIQSTILDFLDEI